MRKIKGSGSYLKNQTRKNLSKAFLCIVLFGLIFFSLCLRVIFTLSLGVFEAAGLLFSLVPLGAFYFYLRKYRIYNGGWQGEKSVAKLLSKTLSDDYSLINDVYLHDGGDIDHIVLGPNGVFVLETKNWSGKINCNGDEWQRPGKQGFKGSPSRQVKRNAAKIRNIIDSSQLKPLGIRVEGIVVFTNNHSSLNINNPTVPILKLQQLPIHITALKTDYSYTS